MDKSEVILLLFETFALVSVGAGDHDFYGPPDGLGDQIRQRREFRLDLLVRLEIGDAFSDRKDKIGGAGYGRGKR